MPKDSNIEQDRINKEDAEKKAVAMELEALSKKKLAQSEEPAERQIQFEDEEDSKHAENLDQIYKDWLKKYKEDHPDFDEDKNNCSIKDGCGCIKFQDPEAEEDFVRYLAKNSPNSGGIYDKGILIATFEQGRLIDPRTKEEFPKGGYASLVSQLDAGKAYKDIPAPEKSSVTMRMQAPASTTSLTSNSEEINSLEQAPKASPKKDTKEPVQNVDDSSIRPK